MAEDRVCIGLDVGFGDVKVVACPPIRCRGAGPPGTRRAKFPSAIAYARRGIIGDLGEEDSKYLYNGREFVVGTPALSSPDVFSTRDIDFLLSYAPLLAYVAVGEVSPEGLPEEGMELCVGMPLAHFHTRKAQLAEVLREVRVSGRTVSFNSVDVRAQGQGILFDFVLDDEGRPRIDRLDLNLLVLDIGFNTVDVLGVVEGRPSREWSDMIERGGISRICEQLGYYLKGEHGFDLSEQSLKDVLQKREIKLYGAKKDLSGPIRSLCEEYTEWLLAEVRSRWEGFLRKADGLIVAGGGAHYVGGLFRDRYPGSFVYVPHEPEYANARGFYKYLRGKTNEGKEVQEDGRQAA